MNGLLNGQQDYSRGDIYYITDVPTVGSEQAGGRPAVIVSNDTNNRYSPVVEIVYLTTQQKRMLPTHVDVYSSGCHSVALCEQILTVSKDRLRQKYGAVTGSEMQEIEGAMLVSLGIKNKDPRANVSIRAGAARMELPLGMGQILSLIQALHGVEQEAGTAEAYMEITAQERPAHSLSFRMPPEALAGVMQELFLDISLGIRPAPAAGKGPGQAECTDTHRKNLERLFETGRPGAEEEEIPEPKRMHIAETSYSSGEDDGREAEEYKGFLLIKCRYCGETKGFCASSPISEFQCSCGRNTRLAGMKPLFLDCTCGRHFKYMTNLADESFTYHCLDCGREAELKLNEDGTAYVTKKIQADTRRKRA